MNAVPVIALDHPVALDAARVGDDAAALAAARAAGLPVGVGVVLTSEWCANDRRTAELVWRIISHDGAIPLTVRPSPIGSSALDPAIVARSAGELLAAALDARAGNEDDVPVLVQTAVRHDWRGVLVGDDGDDAGWRRRRLVHATRRHGDWIAQLDAAGRIREVLSGEQLDHPPIELLARLSRVADRLADVLGGRRDVEWAVDDGHVRLLHVRARAVSLAPVDRLELVDAAA